MAVLDAIFKEFSPDYRAIGSRILRARLRTYKLEAKERAVQKVREILDEYVVWRTKTDKSKVR